MTTEGEVGSKPTVGSPLTVSDGAMVDRVRLPVPRSRAAIEARLAATLILAAAMFAATLSSARTIGDGPGDTSSRGNDARIARVIADLPAQIVTQESRPRPLSEAMRAAKVPSVSVAVFVDGQVQWAQAWGYVDASSRTPATTNTLFQAASISKPLTALAAMKLVEDGKLNLDAEVGDAIGGWRASEPITLRQLLSHSAGLSVSGFSGYASGAAIPTPLQILQGVAPANSPPVVSTMPPGTRFRYSGGGYTVVQMLVEQASGQNFADTLDRLVLMPLGMTRSTFAQPLPLEARLRAAGAHADGGLVAGGSHTYPELAAAGLWSTPTDLGRLAVDVQNAQRSLASVVATRGIAAEMLTSQVGGYGLGFDLNIYNGVRVFEHSGLNKGFEGRLVASAEETGPRFVVIVMTNGEGGTAIADGLIRSIARDYQWQAFAPMNVRKVAMRRSALARYAGLYIAGERSIGIELFEGELYVRDGDWRRGLMIPTGDGQFVVQNRPGTYKFERSPTGKLSALTIDRGDSYRTYARMPAAGQSVTSIAVYLANAASGEANEARFSKSKDGILLATLELRPGRYTFTLADTEKSAVKLGAPLSGSHLRLGDRAALADNGNDLTLEIKQSGTYRFELGTARTGGAILRVAKDHKGSKL